MNEPHEQVFTLLSELDRGLINFNLLGEIMTGLTLSENT